MSQPYAELMDMQPAVLYIPCATYSREQTGDIITFEQFEEGYLLSETRDNTESGNKYYDNSTLSPLISEEEMDTMSSVNEYDAEPMPTDMLEDTCDISQSRTSINSREACYKIRDRILKIQAGWKGAILST